MGFFLLNNTSNEYTLQGAYTANSYIGSVTTLHDVYLALYDTTVSPSSYTGNENIYITDKQISFKFPIKINDEIVLDPRAYGIYFELYAGTSGISFLQNYRDGSEPLAIFNSIDKSVDFFGDVNIPNYYNKEEIDTIGDELPALILNTYTKTEVDTLSTKLIHQIIYLKLKQIIH